MKDPNPAPGASRPPKKSMAGPIGLILGLTVSLGFLAYFFSGIQWDSLLDALRTAQYHWVGIGGLLFLGTYPIRAFRWAFLLPEAYRSTLRHRLSATTIGFMASNVFPGRAGELFRATCFSLKTGLPLGAAIGSIVVERLFDLICVLVGLGGVLVLLGDRGGADSGMDRVVQAGMAFGGITLLIIAGLVLLRFRPKWVRGWVEIFLRPVPEGMGTKILALFDSITQGLTVLSSPLHILGVFVLSVLHWSVAILGIHISLWAFGMDPPILAALAVFVFTALAVALPQAPGYIGVWQVAAEKALGLVGAQVYAAKGFALVTWAASIVPVSLVGFVFLWFEGVSVSAMMQPTEPERPCPPAP